MNRKAAELRDVLLKCSKAELIEVIIRAEGFTYTTFPWTSFVSEVRADSIDKIIEENISEANSLNEKLKSIPAERRVISDNETRNVMIAIHNNNSRYFKLQRKQEKIFHELYDK